MMLPPPWFTIGMVFFWLKALPSLIMAKQHHFCFISPENTHAKRQDPGYHLQRLFFCDALGGGPSTLCEHLTGLGDVRLSEWWLHCLYFLLSLFLLYQGSFPYHFLCLTYHSVHLITSLFCSPLCQYTVSAWIMVMGNLSKKPHTCLSTSLPFWLC